MDPVRVPVLIIGGGGCGLAASNMLSNLGIENVLVETHPTTSIQPKASLINQRTAEILDQHGIYKDVAAVSCPPNDMKFMYYMTSLGGDGPSDRVQFDRVPAYGCNNDPGYNEDYSNYRQLSAYYHTNLPLIRLEPILKRAAECRNPGRVLFGCKVASLLEKEDGVVVEAIDQNTKQTTIYEADYVIAADGGKTVAPMLGISYNGMQNFADMSSIYFKANLRQYWPEGALITFIIGIQGKTGVLGTGAPLFGANWSALVESGPSWGKDCEEWHLHLAMGQGDVPLETLSDDDLRQVVRDILRIQNLEVEKVFCRSRWSIDGVWASRFQTRRIFLVGDAAHRHPPVTGLGLNTGIGDVHNLTWKLAMVLKRQAAPALLQTYEEERQPTAIRVVDWAMFAFMNIRCLDAATGLIPGGATRLAINEVIYEKLTADTFDGSARRAALRYAIASQNIETAARDVELNSIYSNGALLPDSSQEPVPDPRGQKCIVSAAPGHRMPHVWLIRGEERFSTLNLLDKKGSWLFLTDDTTPGVRWKDQIARLDYIRGIAIKVVRIGAHGDYQDEDSRWQRDCALEQGLGGALLVRPDHYVAFRASRYSIDAVTQFEKVVNMLKPFRVGLA